MYNEKKKTCFEETGFLDEVSLPYSNIFILNNILATLTEPRHEKTCLRGLQPGYTQTSRSATKTSQGLESLDIASIDIILSKQRRTKTLIRLRGCAG